jgi:hypothetical protein
MLAYYILILPLKQASIELYTYKMPYTRSYNT